MSNRSKSSESGDFIGRFPIAAGVTTQDLLQQQLLETEASFRGIFEQAAVGVAHVSLDGHFKLANQRYADILGRTREELQACNFQEITHPEDSGKHLDSVRRLLADEIKTYSIEKRYLLPDGAPVWVNVTVSLVRGATGEPRYFVKVGQDIETQKRMELDLRESELRFRTMANMIPQLAWIARADGHLEWYNDRWYEYTGTTPEQMEGWGWQCVHDPRELPRVLEEWKLAIATGVAMDTAFPLRGADGVFRTFLTRVQPLHDSQGRVSQWFGTNTDVETLKQSEEKIRVLNTDLEHRVASRTAQLEAANKELEAFSYSVSHDLRAPLRGMDGYVRMLKEDFADRLDSEGNRMLDVISGEARRMSRLIDDLLAFSRLGRQPLERAPVDMTSLAASAFTKATESIQNKPRFELEPLPPNHGDVSMLLQVFVNLIDNAVKFSSRVDQPVIEVGSRDAPGGTTYYVKDNGVGFDEKYLHKLFSVFQRLHSEAEFEGTGVGLALVQRIIHRHGGKVWAEGKPNHGATFSFMLPNGEIAVDVLALQEDSHE